MLLAVIFSSTKKCKLLFTIFKFWFFSFYFSKYSASDDYITALEFENINF